MDPYNHPYVTACSTAYIPSRTLRGAPLSQECASASIQMTCETKEATAILRTVTADPMNVRIEQNVVFFFHLSQGC